MAAENLDDRLGSILIGAWINVMLYTMEIIQVYRYFRDYPADKRISKLTVISVILTDTICTTSTLITCYLYGVLHWGDEQFIRQQTVTIPSYLLSTGITATIVQIFLLNRYWQLTKRKIVSQLIALMIFISFLGCIGSSVVIAAQPHYTNRNGLYMIYLSNVWLLASAVTDIFIAVALFIRLLSAEVQYDSSKRLVRRLCALSLKTGSLTAVSALAPLIGFWYNPASNICIGFGSSLGRVYALTLLYNLNIRQKLRPSDIVVDIETMSMDVPWSTIPGSLQHTRIQRSDSELDTVSAEGVENIRSLLH
ncbi:hypothetical protein VKT23_012649 [Stygiomarasmius scandens]|uniref:DUF6534 domain-containing protein n=1 Tax=Marasmiellus scandens TaxID=2682957 RepID=A0ABR1J6H4_9AGAR